MELTIRVVCEDLPGTRFEGPEVYERVRLGIQRGEEVIEAVPANQKSVVFEPVFRVAPLPDGRTNFLGPFAKGTQAERFFYLSWVSERHGHAMMFRRAKIHLSHLPWSRVEEAVNSGRPLQVTIGMTDKKGGPRCASIRADQATWR